MLSQILAVQQTSFYLDSSCGMFTNQMHSAQGIYIADPDYSVLNSQYNIHHCPRIQMVLEIVEQAV